VNLATVLKLPVLYVCENNQYSEYTPMEKVTPGGIRPRAEAFGIPTELVDGQDVLAVRAKAQECVDRVRSGEGPVFLEAFTYRYSDHGRGDPYKYRTDEEIEQWRERDPLKLARESLLGAGVEQAQIDAVDAKVTADVDRAAEGALAAPFPEPDRDFASLEFAPEAVA
jgi:TPP-dependent pyruvate/acetoin dehydrogenase alpha subunit